MKRSNGGFGNSFVGRGGQITGIRKNTTRIKIYRSESLCESSKKGQRSFLTINSAGIGGVSQLNIPSKKKTRKGKSIDRLRKEKKWQGDEVWMQKGGSSYTIKKGLGRAESPGVKEGGKENTGRSGVEKSAIC